MLASPSPAEATHVRVMESLEGHGVSLDAPSRIATLSSFEMRNDQLSSPLLVPVVDDHGPDTTEEPDDPPPPGRQLGTFAVAAVMWFSVCGSPVGIEPACA